LQAVWIQGAAAAAAATATKGAATTAAAATATRATTPQADSTDTNKEEGDQDSPGTGPWRYIRTRRPPRLSLWTGSQTSALAAGWLK